MLHADHSDELLRRLRGECLQSAEEAGTAHAYVATEIVHVIVAIAQALKASSANRLVQHMCLTFVGADLFGQLVEVMEACIVGVGRGSGLLP